MKTPLTERESKAYTLICYGNTRPTQLIREMELTPTAMTRVLNSLIFKGYAKRKRGNIMEPIKQETFAIKSTWSQQPPLKQQYESANGKVVPYNYKQLAEDDPLRVHIETLFAKCKPMKPLIESNTKAILRREMGGEGA